MSEEAQKAKETLLEPVKTAIESRLSPFVVSFVISWCLWNWEFLAMMFGGGGTMAWRIWFAKENYLSAFRCFVFPLGSAFAIQPAATLCGHLVSMSSYFVEDSLLQLRRVQEKKLHLGKVRHEIDLQRAAADQEFRGSPARIQLETEVADLRQKNESLRARLDVLDKRFSGAQRMVGETRSYLEKLRSIPGAHRLFMGDHDLERMYGIIQVELADFKDSGAVPERFEPRAFGG
jgi:hypothetical protein